MNSFRYLKAAGFPGQVGMDVAREIDHAISELRDCDRLIVDLRGNPGGGAGGLRLMGYLTPDKVPVGYSLSKKRAEKGYNKEKLPRFGKIPSRKIELFALAFRYAFADKSIVMVTEGLGPQPFHGRIVLLVNQHTASAAETITGFAHENKLATIVGTRTACQVPGGTGFKVGHGFVLRIPVMTFYTWNGNCLEGKGVEPDHIVELSREALRANAFPMPTFRLRSALLKYFNESHEVLQRLLAQQFNSSMYNFIRSKQTPSEGVLPSREGR